MCVFLVLRFALCFKPTSSGHEAVASLDERGQGLLPTRVILDAFCTPNTLVRGLSGEVPAVRDAKAGGRWRPRDEPGEAGAPGPDCSIFNSRSRFRSTLLHKRERARLPIGRTQLGECVLEAWTRRWSPPQSVHARKASAWPACHVRTSPKIVIYRACYRHADVCVSRSSVGRQGRLAHHQTIHANIAGPGRIGVGRRPAVNRSSATKLAPVSRNGRCCATVPTSWVGRHRPIALVEPQTPRATIRTVGRTV
ncbi:hypothetical protein PsYK624_129000 [Phanerochaete sordida]|uniref:Secreted protein n=1 Tax=Phanerochaete sordida TaxID=48140 RepID=A0A9P3GKK7_9APHY|nr:hypothetical protein PsYK624_129000 [Phanerochaete sordida]